MSAKWSEKIKIVFYDYCSGKSSWDSQADAAQAAEEYGKQAGYRCESYLCFKDEHSKPRYHIRAKSWPAFEVMQGLA
jgi:hypothetical protein